MYTKILNPSVVEMVDAHFVESRSVSALRVCKGSVCNKSKGTMCPKVFGRQNLTYRTHTIHSQDEYIIHSPGTQVYVSPGPNQWLRLLRVLPRAAQLFYLLLINVSIQPQPLIQTWPKSHLLHVKLIHERHQMYFYSVVQFIQSSLNSECVDQTSLLD